MYEIFTYIWVIFRANVGKYSTHGAYGCIYNIYIYILDRMTSHILGFEATVCTSFATLVPNFLLEACQYSTTGHRNDRNDSGLKYVLCFIFREMIPIDEFFLG